jgi:hypothetical protein
LALETVLFQALVNVGDLQLPQGTPSSGTKFEDFMVKQLHHALRQRGGLYVYPPRHTLTQGTYSGVAHQFDIVVRESRLAAIECKFRKRSGIDDLFAFAGKLIDYREPLRGIFVTAAQDVNDDCHSYAIARGISIVCTSLPPVEYMRACVKSGTDLARRLGSLHARLQQDNVPMRVLVQWHNEYRRFIQEGYR